MRYRCPGQYIGKSPVTVILPIHGSDGSIRLGKLRTSRDLRKDRIRVVQIKAVGCQVRSVNCGKKASLLQRISEH